MYLAGVVTIHVVTMHIVRVAEERQQQTPGH